MRVFPYVLLVLAAPAAMASTAQAMECLSSADAVWAAHPRSHATWRLRLPGHEGRKCWFARGSTDLPALHVRQAADSPRSVVYGKADSRTVGQTMFVSSETNESALDVAGEGPRSVPQDTLLAERGPLSILIWAGRPMHIDSTWDELFAAREAAFPTK